MSSSPAFWFVILWLVLSLGIYAVASLILTALEEWLWWHR